MEFCLIFLSLQNIKKLVLNFSFLYSIYLMICRKSDAEQKAGFLLVIFFGFFAREAVFLVRLLIGLFSHFFLVLYQSNIHSFLT